MSDRKLYMYRKQNHLCVNCGEKADAGKTRCIRCAQIERVKANERYAELSQEEKDRRVSYQRTWRLNNPDKMAEYAKRKHKYNRRYNWQNERG